MKWNEVKCFHGNLNENVAAYEQKETYCEFKITNRRARVLAKQINSSL
jgi:hypothetical protein